MAVNDTRDLKKFLSVFPKGQRDLVLWLREFVWTLYPGCNELIYDNYNALAFGWSLTDKQMHLFCSVAVYSNGIHFGFYWGSQLSDPEKKLNGKGAQYRFIRVADKSDFPRAYMKKLMKEAFANSLAKVKDPGQIIHGQTIVKSISATKKRPLKGKIKTKREIRPQ